MELRTVEYFLAIVEEGSLRAAASRLGMTQPALTKAMRRLEDETGAQLFDRSVRGMSLTVYGRALLRHARSLHASLVEATREIDALRRGIAGEVRLGAGPSWQTRVLPRAIPAFLSAAPEVRIQVLGGLDDFLKRELRAGRLDFVLAATPDAPRLEPDLEWRSLLGDDYRVVAAEGHPLRARHNLELCHLLAFPWILPGPQSQMAERLHILFRARGLPPPEPVIETDIVPLKLALMRDGPYLSFHAAVHLSEQAGMGIRPLEVAGASWRRPAGIITRRAGDLTAAARALIVAIESACQEETGTRP